jgi:hypothetical protein
MIRNFRSFILAAVVAMVSVAAWPGVASAQRRGGGHEGAEHHGRAGVVIGGGYGYPFYGPFYDPFWGPWGAYWGGAYPMYGDYSAVKVKGVPKEARVYVDGYLAGPVNKDIHVQPGGHEITVFLNGYRTVHQQVYVQPGHTVNMKASMETLGPGDTPEAPPVPSPRQRRPSAAD